MDVTPLYARMGSKNIEWLQKMADASGWPRRIILERLFEFAREKGFKVEKKPVPDYAEKVMKRYKANA